MKKNRIFSVILTVSMLCANLFSSILSVNASTQTLTEKVILNEDFENGVTASTNPLQDGGFLLDERAGIDTGYNSTNAFCPSWVPGMEMNRNVDRTSKYFIPADKIANSGQYCFKFNFYRGLKTAHNWIKLGADETTYPQYAEMTYTAGCAEGMWYFVEIVVDLDFDTYSLKVLNTDNSVKYTTSGSYTYDVISNIAFTTRASNSIVGSSNVSGNATKIDNLYISRLSYDEYEEPGEVEIIAGKVISEDFENGVTASTAPLQDGGFVLDATAGIDTGYNSSKALCPGFVPGKDTARNVDKTSKYFLPADKIVNSGQYCFRFNFYRGLKTAHNWIKLGCDETTYPQYAEMSYTAGCAEGMWYFVEIVVDLDFDTYSLKVLNTDNSVKYTTSGSYTYDVVSNIAFTTRASSSIVGSSNISGYATKIDNLEVYTHFNQSFINLQKNSDTLTVNTEFFSCSWKSNSYLLFLAAYNSEGKLIGIETLEYESPIKMQDEIISNEALFPFVDNATKYKAFLWYDDMTPCCLPSEFDSSKLSEVRINEVPFDEFDKNQSNFEINICAENYPTLSATAVDENSTVSVVQPSNENGGIGTITVIPQGEQIGRTYVFNINLVDYEIVSATAQKVKNGADAVVVVVHDDGGQGTASFLSNEFEKNNLNGTVAIIGTNIVEGEDDNDIINWRNILDNSNGRLNFASHSYSHQYLGETDDEHTVYFGGVPTTYPAGRMTQEIAGERSRINGLFPNERVLAFVKPGVTKPDGVTTQLSSAARAMIRENYIAMRDTGNEVGTWPPADYYQVTSLMAKVGTAELADWRNALTSVVKNKGLLVYLFHSISDSASNLTSSKTDVSALLSDMGTQVAQNKIWSAKFDEAMQYSKEYENITSIEARNYAPQNYMTVSVTDSISYIDPAIKTGKFANRDMYDYPITIKTEIPYDWDYVKLTQNYNNRTEVVKTFVENDKRYAYANVVPDCEAAVLTQATSSDYVGTISFGSAAISGFDPAKFYYKIELPYGTNTAPEITCNQAAATITQATLSNGEGSAFVEYNNLKYEIHYSVKNKINVLAIGNSFSQDSVRVLYNIAKADGVNINPYNAYIAGRNLKGHYDAWNSDSVTYRVQPGGVSGDDYRTLKNIVKMNDWDYVILQGTTHYPAYDEGLWGVNSSNTNTYWTTLKNGITEICPNAKRLVHATWAPINELAGNVNNGMFAGGTPDARGAYLTALLPHEQIGANIYSTETAQNDQKAYIPTAVAIDYLIRHYGFPEYEGTLNANNEYDNSSTTRGVYRDNTCHLTDNVGRILAGLVWYEMITGNSATENAYERSTLSEADMIKLKAAAHYACQNYLTYNPSTITSENDGA